MRQDEVIIQRWDASCGAAALSTLLTYQHGDPVSEKEIAEAMLHRDEYLAKPSLVGASGGFSLLDMQRFVERRGYQGAGYGGLALKNLIEFGPTIVPVLFDGFAHFVVFRGIYQNRVLLADPAYGNRTMPIADFEQAWQQHIGFIVRQRRSSAPANQLAAHPSDFLVPSNAAVRAAALQ
jgi:predicted double-glycine peptidase